MARGGRKRKEGRRQPNGQPYREPRYDKGCEGVQRRQALYARTPEGDGDRFDAGNTFDAIGRAWSAHLLGRNADAKRDAARLIAAQYWRVYGFPTPDSLARYQPTNGGGESDPLVEKIREDMLKDSLQTIQRYGRDVRRAFDQLVIDMNPDQGPAWLDRIIFARRQGRTPAEGDSNMLRLAIIGIELLA